jgi:hypothetical protein
LSIGASAFFVRRIFAVPLMPRMRRSMRSSEAASTRSVLLSSTRSANATCSAGSLSSSTCCSKCFASTIVTMASSWNWSFRSSSRKNVCATGPGSAMPVVSIRM